MLGLCSMGVLKISLKSYTFIISYAFILLQMNIDSISIYIFWLPNVKILFTFTFCKLSFYSSNYHPLPNVYPFFRGKKPSLPSFDRPASTLTGEQ